MIAVTPVTDVDAATVDAYLQSVPGALFYASSRYRALLVELLQCRERSLVACDDDRVCGFLPLLEIDGTLGPVLNSLPYYGSNGGPFADTPEAAAALRSAYNARAADAAAATIVPTPTAAQELDGLAATHGDERIAQTTNIAGLERGELPTGVDASARRNVRKAERAGIVVGRDPGAIAALAAIHRENILGLGGLPKDERFFRLVPDRFGAGDDFDLYVARLDGAVVAGLLVFYFGGVVEYFTPAVRHDVRPLQPLALILAEAMAGAAARGCHLWNWGGTWCSQRTLRRFKRKWGAVDTMYRYRTQINEPGLLQSAPEALLAGYPGFYVVPYSALAAGEEPSSTAAH